MRQRRARPGVLTLVTVLWGALLLGWLQLTPLYRAADEPTHADLVLRLRDGGSYAAPGTLDVDPRIRASFPLANLSTAERPELPDHVPLPFASTDVPPRDVPYDQLPAAQDLPPYANQMTQHPPLYYLLLAGESRLLPGFGGWSFPVQLGALRLLSALLLLPLPALAAAAARRLGAVPAVATAAALLPLAVPQLAHVGASVNNDVLLVLLGAAVAVPLLGVSRGDVSRRTAVVVGVLLGLALLTKAWAVGLLAWAGLAYLLALLGPARTERGRAVGSGLLAAGLAMVVGGWWWVANVVRFGALQPQGLAPFPARETDPDAVAFVLGVLRRLTASTWGNFGWLEVQLAEPVRVTAAVVVTAALALAVARRLDEPWARPAAAVALAAFCLQLAVVGQQSLKNYLRGGYFAGLQGRYLYAFVGVVAALVAIGLARVVPRRVLPLVALVAAVVLQAVGAATALDGFWWADGEGLRRALAVQAAWAPFPRVVSLLTAGVAVACAALLAARLLPSAPAPAARRRPALDAALRSPSGPVGPPSVAPPTTRSRT